MDEAFVARTVPFGGGVADRPPDVCTDFDRAIDPLTGNQRFDLTPPPDLPPPPG